MIATWSAYNILYRSGKDCFVSPKKLMNCFIVFKLFVLVLSTLLAPFLSIKDTYGTVYNVEFELGGSGFIPCSAIKLTGLPWTSDFLTVGLAFPSLKPRDGKTLEKISE